MTMVQLWGTVVAGALFIGGAALLWWPGMRDPGSRGAGGGPDAVATVVAPADPVDEYLAFAEGLQAGPSPRDDVIVDGLRKLAGALGTLEGVDADVPVDLRIVAEHVVLNGDAVETTAVVRTSLDAAARSLDADRRRGPEVRAAVDAIDPQLPLTQQRDRVIEVLARSADRIREDGAR